MIDRGDIFVGGTPSKERAYLRAVLGAAKDKYERLVVPCAGKFSVVEVAVDAGWPPDRIYASDVSLFSSLVAFHCSDLPTTPLGIKVELGANMKEWDGSVAGALYALKLATLLEKAKTYYDELQVRDLVKRSDEHVASLLKGLDALKEKIGGFHYGMMDLWQHLEATLDQKETTIWVNAPGYHKGYRKMYKTGGRITWSEPDYEEFNPKNDHARLRELATDRDALLFRYNGKGLDPDDQQLIVYALERSKGKVVHILSNRPDEVHEMVRLTLQTRGVLDIKPLRARVLPDSHEITPDTTIRFQEVGADQALYYRDLFAHRLGATKSRRHYAMIVDGFVAGVVGMDTDFLVRGKATYDGRLWAYETYGFTAPSYRYSRLNRLLMMLITTRTFLDTLQDNIYVAYGIHTTCLSRYPELKTNRGILKLRSRERLKDGSFKLLYVAEAKPETYKEMVGIWLEKHTKNLSNYPQG